MALEIELKVRVSEPEELKSHLSRLGPCLGPYRKEDTYFCTQSGVEIKDNCFRIRTEGFNSTVTHKVKKIHDGIETSIETEFIVSPPESFIVFAKKLGFYETLKKVKTGLSWDLGQVKAELSEVGSLGYFLELEILLPDSSAETSIHNAKKELMRVLTLLNIPKSAIEPRPYSELIKNNQ